MKEDKTTITIIVDVSEKTLRQIQDFMYYMRVAQDQLDDNPIIPPGEVMKTKKVVE
jgi:hypothetical protein